MPSLSLQGKVAVVTGGSRGIGLAIASTFAEAGAKVALAARGESGLTYAVNRITEAGGTALGVPADVTDPEQVARLVDRTVAELGGLDILVNNAGAAPFFSTIEEMRMDGFEKYFRVNFLAAVYCTKAAGSHLLSQSGSCVLNVASVAAFVASPGLSYYASAKSALLGFTRTVAREWAPSGVRVNALAPGWVATDMNRGAREGVPDFERSMLASIPLGRLGRPEDVANAALFLCSPAASFITGSTLIVDGGQTTTALTTA
jgi:2-deoxy-D-gluconate 3-dehydrogenase